MQKVRCPYCDNVVSTVENENRCSFCHHILFPDKDVTTEKNVDMLSLFRQIKTQYGESIFENRQRVISIMRDVAPELDHEIKLFKLALDSNIYTEFLRVNREPSKKRVENISRIRIILHDDCFLNDDSAQAIIDWFSNIFGWQTTETIDSQADHERNFDFILFHKGKEIRPGVFLLGDERKVEIFKSSSQFLKNVRITYPDGAVFLGTLFASNQYMERLEGFILWPNGDQFQGSLFFRNPIEGKYTWAGGSSYTGRFKNGAAAGTGTFDSVAVKYQGDFFDGYPKGNGLYNFSNYQIASIEGWFEKNTFFTSLRAYDNLQSNGVECKPLTHMPKEIVKGITGNGKITYPDYNCYFGNIRNGHKHGEGILYISGSLGREQLEGLWNNDSFKEYRKIVKKQKS